MAAELEALEVNLRASELISCEWCSVRKLPVLFFQTSPGECLRLRSQLNMSSEKGGQWYDSAGDRKSLRLLLGPGAPPPVVHGLPGGAGLLCWSGKLKYSLHLALGLN